MKKIILLVAVILLATTPSWAKEHRGFWAGSVTHVPEPRLIAPTEGEVNLAGKEALEFEWSPSEGDIVRRDHYDFRVYKGSNRVAESLIFKEKVPKNVYKINLNSNRFEDGQVYTWSVRQVYNNGSKSRKSSSSFKVVKR